jgi:hypothetical protein
MVRRRTCAVSNHEATDGPSSFETRPNGRSTTTHAPKQIDPSASPDRASAVPFGRQGTGWQVAYAALLLISNESSYVNAHTPLLDAGHMAGVVRG